MDTPNNPQRISSAASTSPHVSEQNDIEQNKDIAAFSYLWVMSVIVYFLKRQSPFVRFHSKQAIVLFVLSIIVWLIPVIGQVLELVILAGMVYGFMNAAQGKWNDVPLVGPVSRGEMSLRDAWKRIVAFIARIGHSVSKTTSNEKTDKPSEPPSSNPPEAQKNS